MSNQAQTISSRLGFLDWTRGLAAVIMLQGHVFHSLTAKELRNDGPYVLSQFVGGITPAVFLFLTGVTLAFLLESRQRRGGSRREAIVAGLRRAGYLATIAVLFRLQLWVFAWGQSPWTDLLKVDILNQMALSVGLLSLTALISTENRIRWATLIGVGIAAASPVASVWDTSWMPGFLRSYFVPDYNQFAFFPWAAFVAFGVSAGTLLKSMKAEPLSRIMQWAAVAGFGLVLGGRYFGSLPYSLYDKSEFWLNSPALIFIKLGVILMIAAFAFVWNQQAAVQRWSWVRQLGTTSLVVYWVHIELVYGRWMGAWKEVLPVPQTVAISLVVIAGMLALSMLQTQWKTKWRYQTENWPTWAREYFAETKLADRRVAGD
ncbi:MAG TPA: hypothetical protein DEH78_06300 [Solibacterales bacterium]|nr:hypothetical protein [Bryobacterales bacterium]